MLNRSGANVLETYEYQLQHNPDVMVTLTPSKLKMDKDQIN